MGRFAAVAPTATIMARNTRKPRSKSAAKKPASATRRKGRRSGDGERGSLTPKREAFWRAYLELGNGSEAYRRCFSTERMSPKTVNEKASRLLADPRIAARLAEAQAKIAEKHAVTVDRIIAEYTKIAFADAGDFFDWGPDGVTVKDKDELTPDQRAVVSEVSQTVTENGGTIRVKLHSKMDALEKLGRHLGMFKEAANPVDVRLEVNINEVRGAIASRLDRIAAVTATARIS